MHLQEQQEGGRFDLVVLRAAGMQAGVLEDDAARRVLCEATCVVVEAPAFAGQTQSLLDACFASHGMAEVRPPLASTDPACRFAPRSHMRRRHACTAFVTPCFGTLQP